MAFARIPDVSERFKIGTCPACKCGLYCEVDIQTDVFKPSLSVEGRASITANSRVIAMRFHHECDGRDYSEADK